MISFHDIQQILQPIIRRLSNLETQETPGVANTSYIDALGVAYSLTAILTTVPNWSIDLTEGTYLIGINATVDTTLDGNDNGNLAGIAMVADGITQTPPIAAPLFYSAAAPALRNQLTIAGVWRYTVPASATHTISVKANKTGGTGSSLIDSGNLWAIRST